MSDPPAPAISAAEARRQRILARGAERLDRITGVSSRKDTSASAATEPSTPATAARAKAAAEGATSVVDLAAAAPVVESTKEEAAPASAAPTITPAPTVIAAAEAAEAAEAAPPAPPAPAPATAAITMTTSTATANELSHTERLATVNKTTATSTSLTKSTSPPSNQPTPAQVSPSSPDALPHTSGSTSVQAAPSSVSTPLTPKVSASSSPLWQDVRVSVHSSRMLRVALSCCLAQMVYGGSLDPWSWGVPPLLLVGFLQLVTLLVLTWLIRNVKGVKEMCTKNTLSQAPLPASVQGMDLTALIPGLKDALAALNGARMAAMDMWDGVAVFIVACALMRCLGQ